MGNFNILVCALPAYLPSTIHEGGQERVRQKKQKWRNERREEGIVALVTLSRGSSSFVTPVDIGGSLFFVGRFSGESRLSYRLI